MADSTMLAMLKTDLGISTSTAYNTRLEQLLTVRSGIEQEIVRHRVDVGQAFPNLLRIDVTLQ